VIDQLVDLERYPLDDPELIADCRESLAATAP